MMDKVIQLWSKTNRWHRVLLIFLIVELRLLPKRQRGFECNDPALSYPYTGDTISWKWLLVTVAMLPLAVLLIVERIYSKNDSGASKQQALCWYKEYLFGVLINLTVVQTLKVLVGAPRPHFFDTCSPKEALTCTGSEYVSEYTCMKAHWLSQSDTSFPSGHTSLALHSGIFIAYYLHQRTRSLVKSKIILSAQILSVVSTVFCAVSRITDRRHHWWDVLAGAGIGIPILFYTVSDASPFCLCVISCSSTPFCLSSTSTCLLLLAAVCILLEVGALPSRRSGFTCNDPALSFPHSGDTFSISLVAVVTVVVSFLIMWAVEAIHHREEEYMKQNRLVVSARSAGLLYRDYIYGAVVNLTVLEVVKCVIGSPRPTFFDLCEPDKAKTCNGSEFVSSYTCTSSRHGRYLVIDSTRSFPSAHASLSVYCGLFLAWYLQRRAFSWRNRSVLIVPLLQTCCLIYAAVCSLTRVTDHRHHWWDVLVGGSMGVLSVLYTVLVLCKNFSQPAVVSTSDISSSDGNNHQSVRRLLSSEPHVVVP